MENTKPNILIFTDWFLPAYKAGGPIQSVRNIVEQLSDAYTFFIVTSDTDLDTVLDLPQADKNRWIDKGLYHIIYLDPAHQTRSQLKSLFHSHHFEVIYLNSMFSKTFTILPLRLFSSADVKIVLAPRGMLGKGALAIKPLKKKVYLQVFKILGWHKRVVWHATAETEKKEINKQFGNQVSIQVASNLSKKHKATPVLKSKFANSLNVFFLSRISYKKNLLSAINILGMVDSKFKIDFSIIGPAEERDYWHTCEQGLKKLPRHIQYNAVGAVPNEDIPELLEDQHLLFLPTRHENFGHVIVEAWQNGCPTLISDQTPWVDLEAKNIGAAIPLQEEKAFKHQLERFAAMNQDEFNTYSASAKHYAQKITNDKALLARYQEIFKR